MVLIRQPAVAGSFYPANPAQLQTLLNRYLDKPPITTERPKAMIVPHAGYVYSGECAASAYVCLKAYSDNIKRVLVLGPSHRVGFKGLAVSHAEFFNTPLGKIPLDMPAVEKLVTLPFVQYIDEAHYLEHSLEVQLPFLQTVLTEFKLIPIVVGEASAEQVAQVLELFYDDDETLIVISSDLSHYHDYATAQRLDKETNQKIEHLQYQQLDYDSACGRVGISGLLALAEKKSLKVKNIDLRNSGDTAGDKKRVVGYGAYIID
jgi:MEMO1 family protein